MEMFITQLSKSFTEAIPKVVIPNLLKSVQRRNPRDIAKERLKVESIKRTIKLQLLQQIDNQCQELCVRSRGEPSVLKDSSVGALEGVKWSNIMQEMKDRAPDVLDFIATVATPRLKKNVDEQVPPVCMIYAMTMNQGWQELSLIQKIATIILGIGHSNKKVKLMKALYITVCKGFLLCKDNLPFTNSQPVSVKI